MSKKVDYNAMRACMAASNSMISQWNSNIFTVMEKAGRIIVGNNISGNKADRMKEYLSTVYQCVDAAFSVLMKTFSGNFLVYVSKDYPGIDGALNTVIDEAELQDRYSSIMQKRTELQNTATSAENAIQRVSDLVLLPKPDFDDADAQKSNILTNLSDLGDAIDTLENKHVSCDFTDIDAMINDIESYLTEFCNQSESFKTDFSIERFASLSSVSSLINTIRTAHNNLLANESDINIAVKNLEDFYAQEKAELAKRKERAEWIKIGATAVVSLITAATIVVAPASIIVVGAISGAVGSMVSSVADEYAENGWNPNDWDNNNIVISSCIGGITGMVESLVPAGAGHCVKAGIKAASSALEGALSTSYDQFTSSGKISDVKGVVTNALLDGSSTFVGNLAGSAVSDSAKDFVKQNKTVKYFAENVVGGAQHFEAALRVEGAAKLSFGITKRFTSTATKETSGFIASLLDGKSVSEAYDEHSIISESLKKATDIKLIASDSISAITTAATDNPLYKSEKKLEMRRIAGEAHEYSVYGDAPDLSGKKNGWKDWNSEEYDRMTQKLFEMDERGDDARNYEIYGDPRNFSVQRNDAVDKAWEQERRLVMQGRGTRDWTVSQQEELIRTGRVSGFEGHHMLDASSNPSVANQPDNIQFLTYEEHIDGAHGRNTLIPTSGRYDPHTGETDSINNRQIPHRENTAFELTDKFDYRQSSLADQLGASFGYGRGKE